MVILGVRFSNISEGFMKPLGKLLCVLILKVLIGTA